MRIISTTAIVITMKPFLGVQDVAHLKCSHRVADEHGVLQAILESEKPIHHRGVVKWVSFENHFGLISSDAGRDHLFFEMVCEMIDGQKWVTIASQFHGRGFCAEARDFPGVGVRVTFDLVANSNKGKKRMLTTDVMATQI